MKKILLMSLLLMELVARPFCIEAHAAESYIGFVKDIIVNKTAESFSPIAVKNEVSYQSLLASNTTLASHLDLMNNNIKADSIVVIPIQGAVLKNDYCGTIGTKSMSQLAILAADNPNVKGILLYIDSPGGAAFGTAEASTTLYNISRKLPIVTYCDNMMASAAMWLGSSSNHIIANKNDFTLIGSIGTYMMIELRGANDPVIHTIYADASTQKNEEVRAIMADPNATDLLRQNIINPLNDTFLSAMARNRYGRINKELTSTGKTFQGKDAVKNGLVDALGTVQDAIDKINELAA